MASYSEIPLFQEIPIPSTSLIGWSLKWSLLLLGIILVLSLIVGGTMLWLKISPYIHSLRALIQLFRKWRDSPPAPQPQSSASGLSSSSILQRTWSSNSSNLTVIPSGPTKPTNGDGSGTLEPAKRKQWYGMRVAAGKLTLSVLIDMAGAVVSSVPPFSFFWAPVSSYLIYYL